MAPLIQWLLNLPDAFGITPGEVVPSEVPISGNIPRRPFMTALLVAGTVAPILPLPDQPFRLAWTPIYPSFARTALPRLPGLETGPLTQERVPFLAWLPKYPDFVRSAQLALAGIETGPLTQEHVPFEAWQSRYPDFARSAPQTLTGFWAGPLTEENVPFGDWIAHYPDAVPGTKPRLGGLEVGPLTQEAVPYGSWAPGYLDRVTRQTVASAAQQTLAEPPRPEGEAPEDWAPHYPDLAPGRSLDVGAHPAFSAVVLSEPSLTWLANYPSTTRHKTWFVAIAQTFAVPEVPDTAPILSWQPNYPNTTLPPAGLAAHEQLAFSLWPLPRPLLLNWQSKHPDRISEAPREIVFQAWGAPTTLEIPRPLSWQPDYPDFARVYWPTTAANIAVPIAPEETELEQWLPHYPDIVRVPFIHSSLAPSFFVERKLARVCEFVAVDSAIAGISLNEERLMCLDIFDAAAVSLLAIDLKPPPLELSDKSRNDLDSTDRVITDVLVTDGRC